MGVVECRGAPASGSSSWEAERHPSVSRNSAPWCAMYESIPTSYSLNIGDSRRFTSSMQPNVRPWAMIGEQRMLRVS